MNYGFGTNALLIALSVLGVQAALKERGVPSSVHYPALLSQQLALRQLHSRSSNDSQTPLVQFGCDRVISLPMQPSTLR